MRCPFCRSDSRVKDTRDKADMGIRRRRKCISCGNQWTTFETISLSREVKPTTLTPVQQAKFNLIKEKLRAKVRATG